MATHKDLFVFDCPCCGKRIELDVRSGKARAVDPKEKKGAGDLDQLVKESRQEGQRLKGAFDRAKEQQAKERETLQDLFGKAVEEAKKDKDKKPPNPFDLD